MGQTLKNWDPVIQCDDHDQRIGDISFSSNERISFFQGISRLTGAFYVWNGWGAGGCWDDYYILLLVIVDHSLIPCV